MQETRRVDCLSKSQTACSEDDDGPQEVVEVFFGQNAGTEEEDDRDNSHHAHIAEDAFELVADTPEYDGEKGGYRDEPLNAGEAILHRSDGDDGSVAAWTEGNEEQQPDQYDRDDADWQCDEEPDTPAGRRVHVLESDQVLRRRDRGCGTTDIASQGNSEKQSLRHVGVSREIAEDWLMDVSEDLVHVV